MTNVCGHLDSVKDVTPSADGCEDCLKTGDNWFICACAKRAVTSAAAIHQKTNTQPSIFTKLNIRLSNPLSRAKIGRGAMLTKFLWN